MKSFSKKLMAAMMAGVGMSALLHVTAEAGSIPRNMYPLHTYAVRYMDCYLSAGGQKKGYIDAGDYVIVDTVRSDGWAYGSYPAGRSRVSRWFRLDDLVQNMNFTNQDRYSPTINTAVYTTPSLKATIGTFNGNEPITVVSDNGNNRQVIYKLSNGKGYKMGWVPEWDCWTAERAGKRPSVGKVDNPIVKQVSRPISSVPTSSYSNEYRTNALRAAQAMVEVEWTAPCNFVTWCSSKGAYNSVTAMDGTRNIHFIAGKKYKGIPYSMKGRSYTKDRFLSYVGQHQSTADYEAVYYGHGKKTTKIGIDCSYFVWTALNASGASRKIGGNYTTTSTLLNSGCFSQRSYANMKPGDIFLKRGSHVMMLVEKLANGQCVVYEADANDSKCSRNTYNPNSLSSSGYVGYTFIGYGD